MDKSTQAPRNYHRSVIYDDKAREFAMYLDGDLCGYAKTRDLADATLNQLVYEMKAHATLTAPPITIGEQIANETPGNLTQDEWINLVRRVASVVRAERNAQQAERDRHAAEVQSARWRILGEAAKAMCGACRTGVKVIMLDRQIFHDVPDGIDGCDAEPIQLMIFTEMIAAQEARNGNHA